VFGVELCGDGGVADEEGGGDVAACDDGGDGETEVSAAHYGDADWVGWGGVGVDHVELVGVVGGALLWMWMVMFVLFEGCCGGEMM